MSCANHLDFEIVAHSRLLEVRTEDTIDKTDCGKVLYTAESEGLQLLEKMWDRAKGIRATDTREDTCVFHHWEDFICLIRID